jgi:acetyl-CoA carboxylase carboxyltransferase component
MAMNPFDEQTLTLAFPGISLGGIPALGGANATKADEETRAQMALAETSGAWSAGDTMAYDQIIDPRELRNALLSGLELSINRYSESPQPARHSGIRP